ncbi:hypothetical protein D3C79_896660 [compost metagenome]
MACMSADCGAIGLPFMERRKQPLMRSSRVITLPARGAYPGKNAGTPTKGEPSAKVPALR